MLAHKNCKSYCSVSYPVRSMLAEGNVRETYSIRVAGISSMKCLRRDTLKTVVDS